MSKAFFKEDTVPEDGPAIATRPSEPLPITHEGYARLLAELNAIAKDDEAKKTRALTLKTILATVRVVEPAREDGGVGFGCEVDLEDEDARQRSYRIVGPDEVDARRGLISAESPVGQALMRAREGEEVEVERAGRSEVWRVLRIRP